MLNFSFSENILPRLPIIVIAALSLLGSAFTSFSEVSLFIVDKVRLHKIMSRDRRRSKYLKRLLENHRETLITILFMNLLFNTVFAISMSNLLLSLNVILSTVVISSIIAMFGEILPKVGGYTIAEKMVFLTSRVVYFVNAIGRPIFRLVDTKFVYPFLKRSTFLSRKDRAEIIEIVKRNTKDSRFRRFIEMLDLDAKDVMTPVSDMIFVDVRTKTLPSEIKKSQFIPRYVFVYEGDRGNVVGVVKTENLLKAVLNKISLSSYVEAVEFSPETKKFYDLVVEMVSRGLEVSLVVDEYGNIIGAITPETIFNYVFRLKVSKVVEVGGGMYLVRGDISLKEFNEVFQTEIESQFYNTISGFIVEKLGRIPNKGEAISVVNLKMVVNEVKDGKIESITVRVN